MDLSKTVSVLLKTFIDRDFLLLISEAPGPRTKPGTEKKAGSTNLFALRTCQLRLKQLAYSTKE